MHIFHFLNIFESRPLWREIFFWPRKRIFWIFPEISQASTEKQKDSQDSQVPFCFSAKVWEMSGLVQKVCFRGQKKNSRQRGRLPKMFRKWKISKILCNTNWPVLVLRTLIASSSHNIQKMFWNFLENFRKIKILYKHTLIYKCLEF